MKEITETEKQAPDSKNKSKSLSYEAKMKQLEEIKDKLKSGSLPLAQIKSEMQKAQQLYIECTQELKELETIVVKMETNIN